MVVCGKKSNQRWLWHAFDHATNTVLACVFGQRKDVVFNKSKPYFAPSISVVITYKNNWGAHERHLALGSMKSKQTQKKDQTQEPKFKNVD